jgi:hypothetical protein
VGLGVDRCLGLSHRVLDAEGGHRLVPQQLLGLGPPTAALAIFGVGVVGFDHWGGRGLFDQPEDAAPHLLDARGAFQRLAEPRQIEWGASPPRLLGQLEDLACAERPSGFGQDATGHFQHVELHLPGS